jgi:hypothetical protein
VNQSNVSYVGYDILHLAADNELKNSELTEHGLQVAKGEQEVGAPEPKAPVAWMCERQVEEVKFHQDHGEPQWRGCGSGCGSGC